MRRAVLVSIILFACLGHVQSQNINVASFFEVVSFRSNCMEKFTMDDELKDLLRPNAQLV